MPYDLKTILLNRWAAFIHDLLWIPLVLALTFWLRFNFEVIPEAYQDALWNLILLAIPIQSVTYWLFGLYRGIWRYASLQDLSRIVKAVLLGLLVIVMSSAFFFRLKDIPLSIFVLYPALLILGLTAPRILYRWYKDKRLKFSRKTQKRTIIVGAGQNGEQLLRDLINRSEYLPVAFLDDDFKKHGLEIHGVRVRGNIDNLPEIVTKYDVELILVAIPSANKATIKKIVNLATRNGIECRTLPSTIELVNKEVDVNMIRPVTVEDILGREAIEIDDKAISSYIQGKKVLITGGGGSIGSELCRQIANQKPSSLIILENSEFNLYSIEQELRTSYPDVTIKCVLGDVKNPDRVKWLFATFLPEIVYHAAAYKHVPMLEFNPAEGVNNNVYGTKIVADAADRYETEKFIFVSTDKAVNPSNVMGATKRIAEIYCQNLNDRSKTQFITTRFGNVIGSAGSVVPLFQKQIENGGPVTVTHENVKRYFMTIPEAVCLILQAASMGKGGEIFVLDMGEQVLIDDLAKQMIRLSGFEPGVDIEVLYTGLRPGEKLFEELFHDMENLQDTTHEKLYLANSRYVEWNNLCSELSQLKETVLERKVEQLRIHLKNIVRVFIILCQ